jgi:aminopeptidase
MARRPRPETARNWRRSIIAAFPHEGPQGEMMVDPRVDRMADLMVNYSTRIGKGDRVLIEGEPPAAPLIQALFRHVLQAGGHPFLLLSLAGIDTYTGLDDVFMRYADEAQIDNLPVLHLHAYQEFESRIRIYSSSNTKALSGVDRGKLARRRKAVQQLLKTQFARGATGEFRWLTTLFPTLAQAQDAAMSLEEYEDFVFRACHVHTDDDPVAYWNGVQKEQARIAALLSGHDRVQVRGPQADLSLSIKDRTFLNASGDHNMPDGEVFTGPVEASVNGWFRCSFPAVYQGNEVGGVELMFEDGRVSRATATGNEEFLLRMLEVDPGARYLGEFAFGLNYDVRTFTRNILFDEKIGGTMHVALGAGYPETGNTNQSSIHWDLIWSMQKDSEVLVDGEVVYRDGAFLL